jgi:hypothetical protein
MTAMKRTTIKLPALDESGKTSMLEVLEADQLESGALRLVHSPGFVDGLAAGDEIELTTTTPAGYRVVKRSGNLAIWVFFDDEKHVHGPAQSRLRLEAERLGGILDGGSGGSLIFTIPLRAGFDAIREAFDRVTGEIGGTGWTYGNVYDPKTDAPLNWWK